ncbi:MAG: hypothetical protein QOD26_3849 [Betaproteobacteria bacterium]|nr:hypothetical protein [Betaproteobacteria bacterium]
MDVKDLRYFIAVYEAKGFSKASQHLGRVQSTVSERIQILERTVNAPLFERKWRTIVPTAQGDKLYEYAKNVVAALDHTERTFNPPRSY